jgi:hypothetical protein
MYTVQIGKQFLDLYNQKMRITLTPMQFFDQEYWGLFFNCSDDMQLAQVHNSSFFQSVSEKDKQSGKPIPEIKKDRFFLNLRKYERKEIGIHAGIAVGFMSSDMTGFNSCQITDIEGTMYPPIDDILCSWIGASLCIGLGGAVNLLTEDPDLQWFTFQGWKYYRKLMNDTPNLKGRQIETWNGLWFMLGYRYRDDPEKAYEALTNQINTFISQTGNISKLERPDWYQQIIHWALIESGKSYLVYGYNFGQMNRTFGFFTINLPEIRKPYQFYNELLAKHGENLKAENAFETVFKAEFKIEEAIELGGIGIRALKPKDFFPRFNEDTLQKFIAKNPLYRYQNFAKITWYKAMLEQDRYFDLAEKLALFIYQFRQSSALSPKAKVNAVWDAGAGKQKFLAAVREIYTAYNEATDQTWEHFLEFVKTIHELPFEKVAYFNELTRCLYINQFIFNSTNHE